MSHRSLSYVYIPRLGFDTPVRVTGKTQVTFLEQGVSDETLPLKEVVKRTLRTIEETYFDRGRDAEYQEALELLDSLRVAREGGSNTLPSERKPINHKLVPQAIQAVLKHRPYIEHVAPSCLDDQRCARLQGYQTHIEHINEHVRRAQVFTNNMDAVNSNVLVDAGNELTEIADLLEPHMRRDRVMGDALLVLDEFTSGAARDAAEARKKNLARDKRRDADKADKPAVAAPPAPVTPPPAAK